MASRRLTIRVHTVFDGPHQWEEPDFEAISKLFAAVDVDLLFDQNTKPLNEDPARSTARINTLMRQWNGDAGTAHNRVGHLVLAQEAWPPPEGVRIGYRGVLLDLETRAVSLVQARAFQNVPSSIRSREINQTVAHEIGHMLNLGHVEDGDASRGVLMRSGQVRETATSLNLAQAWNDSRILSPGTSDPQGVLPPYPSSQLASNLKNRLFPLCTRSRWMLLKQIPDERALPHNGPFAHLVEDEPLLVADYRSPSLRLEASVEVLMKPVNVGDPLILKLVVVNPTDQQLLVPCSFDPDSSSIEIALEHNAGIRWVAPSRKLCGWETFTLGPYERAVGYIIRLADSKGVLIDRPGTYHVRVGARDLGFEARARFEVKGVVNKISQGLAVAVSHGHDDVLSQARRILMDEGQSHSLRSTAGIIAARAARSKSVINGIRKILLDIQPLDVFAKIAAIEALPYFQKGRRIDAEPIKWLENHLVDQCEDREVIACLARFRRKGAVS